jgi:hypothetical protein
MSIGKTIHHHFITWIRIFKKLFYEKIVIYPLIDCGDRVTV